MSRSNSGVAPDLYWFLAALGAHLVISLAAFSALWLLPDGRVQTAAGALFSLLEFSAWLPVSSLLWATAIAAGAGLWRRLRSAA